LADAVAASSAFPPVLSPHRIEPSGEFDPSTAGVNQAGAFRATVWLSDGGVYDNLGLQTAWGRCRRRWIDPTVAKPSRLPIS